MTRENKNDNSEIPYTVADRVLLSNLNVKMDNIGLSMKELKDNTIDRIKKLEDTRSPKWDEFEKDINKLDNCKSEKDWTDNLMKRTEKLENWKSGIAAVFGLFGVVVALVVFIYLNDKAQFKEELKNHEVQSDKKFDQLLQKLEK